jgi:transcription elongation factor/antiterminator RfaH
MEPTQSPAWYAVYTKHQHEKTAKEYLASQGIEVLLPVYRTIRRWQDRNKVVDLPLFPCYLFVQTNLQRKVEILKAPGVFSMVESGGRACEIEDAEIESIIKATANPSQVTPHPYLKSGDRVRIQYGALAGIEGILTRFKNQFRVVMNLRLLNKAIAVEVDISTVERVGEGKSIAAPSDSLISG